MNRLTLWGPLKGLSAPARRPGIRGAIREINSRAYWTLRKEGRWNLELGDKPGTPRHGKPRRVPSD